MRYLPIRRVLKPYPVNRRGGPGADRHAKLLTHLPVEASLLDAYTCIRHTGETGVRRNMWVKTLLA